MYDLDTFLTHELIHPIHYYINPDFYRGNFNTPEEKYHKTILVEGIATKLNSILTNNSDEQIYWFGFLDIKNVNRWMNNCEEMKGEFGRKLEDIIQGGTFDDTLYNRLFGIDDFEEMHMSRLGYYYGNKIVGLLIEHYTIDEILRLSYDEAHNYINAYFSEVAY